MFSLLYKKELKSTNTFCKENIENLQDKTVVYCDIQTQGRGRFQRKWQTENGLNITASIFIKNPEINILSNLPQFLSIIICRILKKYEIKPQIKWPNDILINGKKICGILSEAVFKGNSVRAVIIGFGINVNTNKSFIEKIDKPATSLLIEIGKIIDKEFLLNEIVEEFFANYDKFIQKGFISLKKEYLENSSFIGKEITISLQNKEKTGVALDILDNGNLVFMTKDNEKMIINNGEINF